MVGCHPFRSFFKSDGSSEACWGWPEAEAHPFRRFFKSDGVSEACWGWSEAEAPSFQKIFQKRWGEKSLLSGNTHPRTRFFKFDVLKKACLGAAHHPFRNFFISDGVEIAMESIQIGLLACPDVGYGQKCLNGVHPQKNSSNFDGNYEFLAKKQGRLPY